MREEHVKDILEGKPLSALTGGELASVREHSARCDGCKRAYMAARLASLLVRERAAAAAEIEPPPFFQTRVLAALRERRGADEPALRRLWRAAGSWVSAMAVTTALLAGLTLTAPGLLPGTGGTEEVAASDPYSEEAVLLAQEDEEFSYERVLETIYQSEEDSEGSDGQNR